MSSKVVQKLKMMSLTVRLLSYQFNLTNNKYLNKVVIHPLMLWFEK